VTLPPIVVNCKAYPEASGAALDRLLRAAQEAAVEVGVDMAVAPPMPELARVAKGRRGRVRIWAQHVDDRGPGVGTGYAGPDALLAAGAKGAILNHAEHKVGPMVARDTVARCIVAGLPVLVCADSVHEARLLARFKPMAIAIEPPELIGGDVSVTSADPTVVAEAVEAVRRISTKTKVLCGAGVKTGYDVAKAIELGAHGVLVASGVVKAKKPLVALRDLCAGL
jgi:triosephosphate isomerase